MSTLFLHWAEHPPVEATGGAATVGNFDGVHRGHRELVQTARRWATRHHGPTVAVTFDPPPIHILHPAAIKPPLSTLAERVAMLHAAGADHVIVLRTEPALLALSPEAFFEDVLVRQLQAKAVVEGYNFRFGRARAGDMHTLQSLCATAGLGFEEVPPLVVNGEPVSSSRVRAEVVAGNVTLVEELLGRPYRIAGVIESGAKRGRTIGFPTANVGNVETLVPAVGVYAVRAVLADGTVHPAAANIGPNPTFGEDARKIEVHLIGYTGDLYGQPLTVEFAARLRDTRPFAGVAELVEQLKRDMEAAKGILAGRADIKNL